MYDFDFEVPVKILFGKNGVKNLAEEILKYGKRVLLCYGSGSIKKIGLYDEITEQLKSKNIFFKELSGISPNPRITEVEEGVKTVRENNLDFILPVGGGSTIDCAKAVSACVNYQGNAWDIITGKAVIQKALPIGTVLTIAATGSEMNCGAVISNLKTKEKLGFADKLLLPKFSVLNPEYTFSVPKIQTAAGTADIMSHTFECYFSLNDGAFLQDRFAESILKTCIKYGPIAIREPENYEARANLLWANSWAINGLLDGGKNTAWSVHPMEHELSAFYDITHGIGLAILTPHWLSHCLNSSTVEKIADYGKNVWNLPQDEDVYKTAQDAIQKTHNFFVSLGIPMTLKDVNIGEEHLEEMAEAAIRHRGKNGKIYGFQELTEKDVLAIYKAAM
ncbi:iron-containing alcohol dehydrogenase [Treponema pedis]|uniref:Iron-containing alcohol dehydrogenase n=1 Tax=Treponema pedis TaxID=409322 RepID=A0A7S6WM81_9SPIR|nr:iron-containing alcohol dehydrogenase [Treponema pedis]QOW59755.1 iron-containing alcohol dehydrogenase [Treponema pedis]